MTCVQDCQREAELEKRIAELETALRPFVQALEGEPSNACFTYTNESELWKLARKALEE